MLYTILYLLILFIISLSYSSLLSLMTFGVGEKTFFPSVYKTSIDTARNEHSDYYKSLLATTIGSYITPVVLFILLVIEIGNKRIKNSFVNHWEPILGLFILSILIILALGIILAVYCNKENTFTYNNSNQEYNYPMVTTFAYLIFFIIFGSLYIHCLKQEEKGSALLAFNDMNTFKRF